VIKRLSNRHIRLIRGRSEGQTLLLFAVMLPLIIVVLAFVVDGAHAFVDRNTGLPQT
jgi:Flp pilus assembly protein TadG